MNITVGQSHKHIMDPSRAFQCGLCRAPLTVRELVGDVDLIAYLLEHYHQGGSMLEPANNCTRCGNNVCIFCGCADTAPCINRKKLRDFSIPCSWAIEGVVCDFCIEQLPEALFYLSTERPERISPFAEPERNAILSPHR